MMTYPSEIGGKPVLCRPAGPTNADIMIIGEVPGAEDCRLAVPFAGFPGTELSSQLAAVGISRDNCYLTTVSKTRVPRDYPLNLFADQKKYIASNYLLACKEQILQEIETVRPKIIIALGSVALWTLTGNASVTKWRGSQLTHTFRDGTTCWLLPTYSPQNVMTQWVLRSTTVNDLRKAARWREWKAPEYDFLIRPTLDTVLSFLSEIETRAQSGAVLLAGDLETRAGHIACFGIATSALRALCIPFMDIHKADSHYWTDEEEITIVQHLVRLFHNPKILWAFQNGTYDFQYFSRHWGAIPHLATDTMIEHHTAWTGDLPKGLDFLSSMYCSWHVYWKEDGKLWDPRITPEETLWEYNCKDCVTTWEVATVLATQTEALGLQEQVKFQTLHQFNAVLKMMLRGVRRDHQRQAGFSKELSEAFSRMQEKLDFMVGAPINVKSPKQLCELFYDIMGLPVQKDRRTKRPTTGAKVLPVLKKKAAWCTPIVNLVELMRSIGVFKSTFVDMEADEDGRIRCSYNIAGTETLRYSSSKNAFGSGGNLQNIPTGKDAEHLPNVKNLFIPDKGYIIAEHDLAQADAQIVAWEADDAKLKYIFRNEIDLHLANASDMYNLGIRLEDISDPDGIEWHKKKYPVQRQLAKAGCHAINYGVAAYTLAATLGLSVRDAQAFIDKWFSEHPGIRDWHERTLLSLQTTREVRNRFGFRRYYFDRIEGLLPEALAWIPQSTVALVVDKGIVNITEQLPEAHVLLQVHDSMVNQYPADRFLELLPKAHKLMTIEIPYPDPLIIPMGVAVSSQRWGAKREIPWDFNGEVTW